METISNGDNAIDFFCIANYGLQTEKEGIAMKFPLHYQTLVTPEEFKQHRLLSLKNDPDNFIQELVEMMWNAILQTSIWLYIQKNNIHFVYDILGFLYREKDYNVFGSRIPIHTLKCYTSANTKASIPLRIENFVCVGLMLYSHNITTQLEICLSKEDEKRKLKINSYELRVISEG